jgi:hypothetical protein
MILKQHFAPDADIIRAILVGLQQVKGHCIITIQLIKDQNSSKVSVEAELNVEADKLASIELTKKRTECVKPPRD